VVTVSDRVSRGEYDDRGGPLAVSLLQEQGWAVTERRAVPDEVGLIADAVRECCEAGCTLVLTTGGTGLAARDVTPEAVRTVIEREVPGIAEAMRAVTFGVLAVGMLSRQVAGTRGSSLIVTLPGSTGGVREGIAAIAGALGHAVDLLAGETQHT
jgi:molybdenum cofactor biosynthesis protein B